MVLDYDDTLCPSSWISAAPERVHAATDADAECLRRLEDGIEALLQRAEALNCKVVIITNADEDWVRFSSQQFLPRIVPLLQNLRVVSARRYEHLYPGRSVCWKAAAEVSASFCMSARWADVGSGGGATVCSRTATA